MLNDDIPVIDAAVHGFDWNPANINMQPGKVWPTTLAVTYQKTPEYRRYVLECERAERKHTAEELYSTMFLESQTDIAVYHVVRRLGLMNEGEWSPLDVGLELRQRAGAERVRLMAGLSDPFDTARSIDELDQYIDEHDVVGLKLYPFDWDSREKRMRELLFNDEEHVFSLIEHARKRGLKHVAIHKAFGHLIRAFGVSDMDSALSAFPDIEFEIVHGGWAFLDDTAMLATRHNVWINLEGTSALLAIAPRRFGEILGRFLQSGSGFANAEDRVLWATGAVGIHPQPLLELFWKYQMPADLVNDYGYPELTDELKMKILAGNYARKYGTKSSDLLAAIPEDEALRRQRSNDLVEPWSAVPHEPAPEVAAWMKSGGEWKWGSGYNVLESRDEQVG
jgi:uncharacterized protein